jgi:Protein of unknown function (DUF2958)
MTLLTSDLRERLLENGRRRGLDHEPVVKFFNPLGSATWLATELDEDEDEDTLYGLADLGFGSPELGSFSLAEMESLRLPFDMAIERDLYFEATFPLSVYTEAAYQAGRIVFTEQLLRAAPSSLRESRDRLRFPGHSKSPLPVKAAAFSYCPCGNTEGYAYGIR